MHLATTGHMLTPGRAITKAAAVEQHLVVSLVPMGHLPVQAVQLPLARLLVHVATAAAKRIAMII